MGVEGQGGGGLTSTKHLENTTTVEVSLNRYMHTYKRGLFTRNYPIMGDNASPQTL